jgi:putative flippase GtrA
MQLLLYVLIGTASAAFNVILFSILNAIGVGMTAAVVLSFIAAAAVNYLLCIAILFRHKARWTASGEIAAYLLTIAIMGSFDAAITIGLVEAGLSPVGSKSLAAILGLIGNFMLRRYLVFPEKSVTAS